MSKFYTESKDGISWQLFKSTPADEFYLTGLVGKGLNLGPYSSGNHVFFLGGTGVLPCFDLIGYLFWRSVHTISPHNSVFPDETFKGDLHPEFFATFNIFYTRKEESIGLELLEGLQ